MPFLARSKLTSSQGSRGCRPDLTMALWMAATIYHLSDGDNFKHTSCSCLVTGRPNSVNKYLRRSCGCGSCPGVTWKPECCFHCAQNTTLSWRHRHGDLPSSERTNSFQHWSCTSLGDPNAWLSLMIEFTVFSCISSALTRIFPFSCASSSQACLTSLHLTLILVILSLGFII